jgi:hypothetical protein
MSNLIKEEDKKTLSPSELNPDFIKKIETEFGPVDMENDFFSFDLSNYYKVDKINPETNSVSHKVIKLASFQNSLIQLSKALDAMIKISQSSLGKSDTQIQGITQQIRDIFNKYRTYIRKSYPEQYSIIKSQLEEISMSGGGAAGASFSPGTGEQYATPFAFNKNKKALGAASNYYYKLGYKLAPHQVEENDNPGATLGPGPKATEKGVVDNYYVKGFKYKLVPKKIPGSGLEVKQLFEDDKELSPQQKFQNERIQAFNSIENKLNNIYKMISNNKNKTIEYYQDNPASYTVVYPTDLILDYLNDIITLLKQ